jgi:CBS domain-containing membrane protein
MLESERICKKENAMFQVKNIMTKDVFTLNFNESLSAAKDLMDLARIRHIPIVDDQGVFAGLLTHRDILAATISELAGIDRETQDEIESGIPIREIMQTDVVTVSADLSLKEAARLLLEEKYGCLPVICEGKLCGIITEADFLRLTIDLMEAVEPED